LEQRHELHDTAAAPFFPPETRHPPVELVYGYSDAKQWDHGLVVKRLVLEARLMTFSIGEDMIMERLAALEVLRQRKIGEKVHLDPDFREFVESFVTNDVRFLIVGGYAVAVHGLPRYTAILMPGYG